MMGGCDGDSLPGVEADGVGGMSSATRKSPGESRWCVGRLLVAPWERRRQQRGCWGYLRWSGRGGKAAGKGG